MTLLLEDKTTGTGTGTGESSSVGLLESIDFPDVVTKLADRLSLPVYSILELQQKHQQQQLDRANRISHVISIDPYHCGNVRDYALGICALNDSDMAILKMRKIRMNPFVVDFCPLSSSRLGRRSLGETGPDLLNQAVSPRKGYPDGGAVVYDLTAGFGQDALLMATAGAKRVHMVEQNPVLAYLIEDGLRRLALIANLSSDEILRTSTKSLSNCLSIECGDGIAVAQCANELPDIVYLDPMFPARRKRALVKKNMQILHSLLHSQATDMETRERQEESLLRAAFAAAKNRVVVKRPIDAPFMGFDNDTPLRPAYQVSGPVNRWDVYIK